MTNHLFSILPVVSKKFLINLLLSKKKLSPVALLPPGSIFLSKLKNRSKDKQNGFTGKQDSLYIKIFSYFRKIKPSM